MPAAFTFVVRGSGYPVTSNPKPGFILLTDKWDDYGHKVQFHLFYVDADGAEVRVGALKILRKVSGAGESMEVALTTKLKNKSFTSLDDDFISIGQEDDYYKSLHKLIGQSALDVLEALRDIALKPALAKDFEPTSGFRNALMRENSAHRARRFGAVWASGSIVHEKLSFEYLGAIEGADEPVEATIAFDAKDRVPGRIVGVIGRNAVGKTQFLASLAADLAQITRSSAKRLAQRDERFPQGRPLFTRVLAISYNAFDRFQRPTPSDASSYVYCGIRSEKGGLSRSFLVDAFRQNQDRIRRQRLQSDWTQYMVRILGDTGANLKADLDAEIAAPVADDNALSLLSSGQSILTHFVTAVLAWIQPNSLVLFDEPETHLHPNAVASLFLVLSDILKEFDSYAIVATHSPLVIQEIPAKRVLVFHREGNVTTAAPLALESFGESVTELTRHVFETIEVDSVYRRTFTTLAKQMTAEQILGLFDRGLSLSAQAYLLAQFASKPGKKK